MALKKITNYPAKSQAFTASDLFDVSKFVTQTSGQLRPTRYTIVTYVAGDDFSNVATVVSGTINTTGCVFDAIGTTPTDYSNGSTLSSYESQSYTYAELALEVFGYNLFIGLIKQSTIASPVIVPLKTSIGSWSTARNAAGDYDLINTGSFPDSEKLFIAPFGSGLGSALTYIPILDLTTRLLVGYYTVFWRDADTLGMQVVNTLGVKVDLSTLIGDGNSICLPDMKIFA